jgi:hypothetical protein
MSNENVIAILKAQIESKESDLKTLRFNHEGTTRTYFEGIDHIQKLEELIKSLNDSIKILEGGCNESS